MKKLFISFALFLLFISLQAQDKFPLAWQANHGFKPTLYKTWDDNGTWFLGVSEKEISVIGTDGKSLWKFNFQEKLGFKEAKSAWSYNNGVVEVIFKPNDKKSKEEITVLFDAMTGKELWRTGKGEQAAFDALVNKKAETTYYDNSIPYVNNPVYKIYGTKIRQDINTTVADYGSFVVYRPGLPFKWGSVVNSSIYVPENDISVKLSYERKLLRAAIGKNTTITVSANKGGNSVWTTELKAKIVSTCVSDEDMIDFFVSQGKVIVVYEGISVIDLNTGKLLWTSEFNNSEVSVGLKVKQELMIADMPLATNDGIYIVDLTSDTYGIKKCDLETGKVIWKSPKYSSSDIIPFITIQNGVLIAKFGGIINVQSVVTNANTGAETYITEYKMRGKAGIKAFDCKTGALLWDEKKLGDKIDFISDFIQEDGKVSFFSDKAFYTFDIKSGEMKSKIAIQGLKVEKVLGVFKSYDNKTAYAIYDNGIFAVDISSGKTKYELKVSDINGFFKRGNRYFAQIGENLDKLVSIDLENGKAMNKMEARKSDVAQDGKHIIQVNWEAIQMYEVK
ncbi:MAG: PQQ-binding-like beta-propeller repeat protein [Cytophagaceae bacterium]|nr:PQQ-binding-like beta-propeller repeat protein [Cytophagaceae bacterium]